MTEWVREIHVFNTLFTPVSSPRNTVIGVSKNCNPLNYSKKKKQQQQINKHTPNQQQQKKKTRTTTNPRNSSVAIFMESGISMFA